MRRGKTENDKQTRAPCTVAVDGRVSGLAKEYADKEPAVQTGGGKAGWQNVKLYGNGH